MEYIIGVDIGGTHEVARHSKGAQPTLCRLNQTTKTC